MLTRFTAAAGTLLAAGAARPQSQQLMQSGGTAPRGAGWWAGVVLATLAAGAFTGVVLGPHYIWVGLVSVPLVVGEWLARIRRIVLVLAGLEAGDAPARLHHRAHRSSAKPLLLQPAWLHGR